MAAGLIVLPFLTKDPGSNTTTTTTTNRARTTTTVAAVAAELLLRTLYIPGSFLSAPNILTHLIITKTLSHLIFEEAEARSQMTHPRSHSW